MNKEEKEEDNVKKDEKHHEHKHYKEEIIDLNNKLNAMSEEVLRSKAELINYRKRKDEEVSNMLRFASSDLISSLLNIKDNFERALSIKEENLTPDLKNFLNGFKMIYTQFDEILKSNGVEEINPLGEKFDSKLENALFTESDISKENDIVTEVFSKGYTYNEKILRCAQVKVNMIDTNNKEKENDINE